MNDFKVEWKAEEREAIKNLAVELDMPASAVIRQAVRLYQLHHHRLANGETCHWSGDEQRARDFAGPLATESARLDAIETRMAADVAEDYAAGVAGPKVEDKP